MTTLAHPPGNGADQDGTELVQVDVAMLRNACQRPPDVCLDLGARWCPVDDTVLRSSRTLGGLWCETCAGAWDWRGCNGRWLAWHPTVEPQPVSDEPVQPPAVAGSGVRAVGLFAAWTTVAYAVWIMAEEWRGTPLPDELIYTLAGLVGATALIRIVWAVIRRGR